MSKYACERLYLDCEPTAKTLIFRNNEYTGKTQSADCIPAYLCFQICYNKVF